MDHDMQQIIKNQRRVARAAMLRTIDNLAQVCGNFRKNPPPPQTVEERLAAIEERLDAIEEQLK